MQQLPYWLSVISALAIPSIAFGGGIIALMQWRTAHQRLRLDLFKQRLAIHNAVYEMIGIITTQGKAELEDLIKIQTEVQQIRWLMSKEAESHIRRCIIEPVQKISVLSGEEAALSGDDLENNLAQQCRLRRNIEAQRGVLHRLFDPFLKMSN